MQKNFKKTHYPSQRLYSLPTRFEEAVSLTYGTGGNVTNVESIDAFGTKRDLDGVMIQLTQAEYDALSVKDPNALYLITE